MKAAFGVEAIGLDPGQERDARRWRMQGDLAREMRPWCAELVGFDLRYGFRRRFLRPKIDYTAANSRGSRGVWFWWTLAEGRFYEAKYPVTWQRHRRLFLTATRDGDLREDLTLEEVQQWLSARLASTS